MIADIAAVALLTWFTIALASSDSSGGATTNSDASRR